MFLLCGCFSGLQFWGKQVIWDGFPRTRTADTWHRHRATGRRITLASLSDACDVLRWIVSEIIFWSNARRSHIFSEKLLKRLFDPGWSPFFSGSITCAWLIFNCLIEENIPSKLQEVGQTYPFPIQGFRIIELKSRVEWMFQITADICLDNQTPSIHLGRS